MAVINGRKAAETSSKYTENIWDETNVSVSYCPASLRGVRLGWRITWPTGHRRSYSPDLWVRLQKIAAAIWDMHHQGHEDGVADKPHGQISTTRQTVLGALKYSHPSVKSNHKSRSNRPGNTTDGHRAQIRGILPAHLTKISTSTLKCPSQK